MARDRTLIEGVLLTPVRELKQSDLIWLRCPICRSALQVGEAAGLEVRCGGCERGFPIVDGLPVLLADRAKRYI